MYAVFNRGTLQLEALVDKLQDHHYEPGCFAANLDGQREFRRPFDQQRVSQLEVALMYRNASGTVGPIHHHRDTLLSDLYYLLTAGKPAFRHSVPLFNDDPGPTRAGTASDRSVAAAVTRAPAPRAPAGGNRAVIFEVADKEWADAGSPQDVPTVLVLRKKIMVKLETEYDIKKSTSSTALGAWQKLRLNT